MIKKLNWNKAIHILLWCILRHSLITCRLKQINKVLLYNQGKFSITQRPISCATIICFFFNFLIFCLDVPLSYYCYRKLKHAYLSKKKKSWSMHIIHEIMYNHNVTKLLQCFQPKKNNYYNVQKVLVLLNNHTYETHLFVIFFCFGTLSIMIHIIQRQSFHIKILFPFCFFFFFFLVLLRFAFEKAKNRNEYRSVKKDGKKWERTTVRFWKFWCLWRRQLAEV